MRAGACSTANTRHCAACAHLSARAVVPVVPIRRFQPRCASPTAPQIAEATTEVSDDRVLTIKNGGVTLLLREDKAKDPLESWEAAILTHLTQYAGGVTGADL